MTTKYTLVTRSAFGINTTLLEPNEGGEYCKVSDVKSLIEKNKDIMGSDLILKLLAMSLAIK